MTRAEYIDKAETVADKAALLVSLVCESTKERDCPHKCDECQERVQTYLEEDLDAASNS